MSWSKPKVERWLAQTDFNLYQGIDLPYGLEVPGPRRDDTVDVAFEGLPISDTSVLVVGSHYGCVPNILADRGARIVLGMEARPVYFEIAKTIVEIRGVTGIVKYVCGNAEHDPLPGGQFDYVTLFNVNHHFENPIHTLKLVASKATNAFLMEWATFDTYNERHDAHVDTDVMECFPLILGDRYGCWYMSQLAIEAALRSVGFKRFDYATSPKASSRRIVQCLR